MRQHLWVCYVIYFYTHDFVNSLFLWSSDVRHLNPVTTYNPGGNRNWVDSLWSLSVTRVCRYVGWWLDNRIPYRLWTNTRLSIRTPYWTNCTLILSIPTWWVTTIWRWLVTIRPKCKQKHDTHNMLQYNAVHSVQPPGKQKNILYYVCCFICEESYLKIATNAGQYVIVCRDDVQLIDDWCDVFDATTSAVPTFGIAQIRWHLI